MFVDTNAKADSSTINLPVFVYRPAKNGSIKITS